MHDTLEKVEPETVRCKGCDKRYHGTEEFFVCNYCHRFSITMDKLKEKMEKDLETFNTLAWEEPKWKKTIKCPQCKAPSDKVDSVLGPILNTCTSDKCLQCPTDIRHLYFEGCGAKDFFRTCTFCDSDYRVIVEDTDDQVSVEDTDDPDPAIFDMPHKCCDLGGCYNCWNKWIKEKVNKQTLPFPSLCGCKNGRITSADVAFIQNFEAGKSRKAGLLFTQKNICGLKKSLNGDEELIQCPYPNCPGIWTVSKNFAFAECVCPTCDRIVCRLCKRAAHESSDCPEDETVLLDDGSKRCPNCRSGVFKEKGECNKVICRSCELLFCFACLREPDDEGRLLCTCTADADEHQFVDPKSGSRLSGQEVKKLINKSKARENRKNNRPLRRLNYANRSRRNNNK